MFCLTECPLFVNVAMCCLVTVTVLSSIFRVYLLLAQVIDSVFPGFFVPLLSIHRTFCAGTKARFIRFHEAVEYMCWLPILILPFSIDISIDTFHFAGTYLDTWWCFFLVGDLSKALRLFSILNVHCNNVSCWHKSDNSRLFHP